MKRTIHPDMVAWLDGRLTGNGLALEAKRAGNARLLFSLAAQALVGVREHGGNNCGPLVELMQRTIGRAEKEAWCMSLVQTCLAYAEIKTGARSPIAASEHCMTVWHSTPKTQRVKKVPAPGAITIWQHGAGPAGHTGVMVEWQGRTFNSVEGNTESGTSGGAVVREGGGVYYVERGAAGTGKMRVVGWLKPF